MNAFFLEHFSCTNSFPKNNNNNKKISSIFDDVKCTLKNIEYFIMTTPIVKGI